MLISAGNLLNSSKNNKLKGSAVAINAIPIKQNIIKLISMDGIFFLKYLLKKRNDSFLILITMIPLIS